eukprot:m.29374 g.29374  ORF g.29374 m.29374 type:complete len:227 (-) comp6146_c0_seq1:90-770(-)
MNVVEGGNKNSVVVSGDVHDYYCLCGTLALITAIPLEGMKRRKTDNAIIFDGRIIQHKDTLVDDITLKLLRGDDRKEFQYGRKCSACGLPISYKVGEDRKVFYIREGSLLHRGEESPLSDQVLQANTEEKEQELQKQIFSMRNVGEAKKIEKTQAMSIEKEEMELEKHLTETSYEMNARAIHRVLGKQRNPQIATTTTTEASESDGEEAEPIDNENPKKKGTLIDQ